VVFKSRVLPLVGPIAFCLEYLCTDSGIGLFSMIALRRASPPTSLGPVGTVCNASTVDDRYESTYQKVHLFGSGLLVDSPSLARHEAPTT